MLMLTEKVSKDSKLRNSVNYGHNEDSQICTKPLLKHNLYHSVIWSRRYLGAKNKNLYLRLTQLHQVLVCGVGRQSPNIEVRFAQLIPSWVATATTVVITAGGAGAGRGHRMGWDQRLLENKDHSVRMLHGTCVQHHSEVARSANQDIYIYRLSSATLLHNFNLHLKKDLFILQKISLLQHEINNRTTHSLHALEIRLKFCKIFFTYFKEYIQDSKWTCIKLCNKILIHSHSEVTGLLKRFSNAEKHLIESCWQFYWDDS